MADDKKTPPVNLTVKGVPRSLYNVYRSKLALTGTTIKKDIIAHLRKTIRGEK